MLRARLSHFIKIHHILLWTLAIIYIYKLERALFCPLYEGAIWLTEVKRLF